MERQNFIDWMKAVGMFFIIVGHVVGSPYNLFNLASQPIYTKQLGVCFFIFIMGWGLANEHRTSFQVVFKRAFPIYFYGIAFALLLSVIFAFTKNDINESNYLPFMLGINVFFNNFPANPTTWYIGTYLHVLLFWFFFIRGRQVTNTHLVIALFIEISIRALLLYFNKHFVAYMLLPNWITVFMLGGYLFQRKDTHWRPRAVFIVSAWIIVVAYWASPLNTLVLSGSFPFRQFTNQIATTESWASILLSIVISVVYLLNTFVFFELFRRLPCLGIVKFFARNSLITFIIHMPLVYALNNYVYLYFEDWVQRTVLILLIFIGTAIISELIQKIVNVRYFQDKAWRVILAVNEKWFGAVKL